MVPGVQAPVPRVGSEVPGRHSAELHDPIPDSAPGAHRSSSGGLKPDLKLRPCPRLAGHLFDERVPFGEFREIGQYFPNPFGRGLNNDLRGDLLHLDPSLLRTPMLKSVSHGLLMAIAVRSERWAFEREMR